MCDRSCVLRICGKYFPILQWGPKYQWRDIKNDVIAGLTVGVTLIPQGLAYGSVAGLRPQYGLFSAFWGPLLYFLLGTSRDLTIGPTAILSLLVGHYSRGSPIANDPTYAIALALLSGCIQLILGLFKLGFIANYMSPTVVSAFTTSGAILIGWGQVKTLLGLSGIQSEFFQSVFDIFKNIKETNLSDFGLGIVCIAVLLAFKILAMYTSSINNPSLRNGEKCFYKFVWYLCISSNILVIAISSLFAYALEQYNIGQLSLVGPIKKGFPESSIPKFQIYYSNGTLAKDTKSLFSDIAMGIPVISLIALVEAMAIGKAFARRNGYRIRSSQEFIAIGIGNIVNSFFQSIPITGSFSRTAINSQCSSKSPASGIAAGILVIISVGFLVPYFRYVPDATLAAIIIVAVSFMTDFKHLHHIWRLNKIDVSTWILTFIVSISFGVEYGVFTGMGFSLLPIIFNASRPKFKIRDNQANFLGSYLWFPNISRLGTMIENLDQGHFAVLNLQGVYFIDSAVYYAIIEASVDMNKNNRKLVILCDRHEILEMFTSNEARNNGIYSFISENDAITSFPELSISIRPPGNNVISPYGTV